MLPERQNRESGRFNDRSCGIGKSQGRGQGGRRMTKPSTANHTTIVSNRALEIHQIIGDGLREH